MSTTSNRKFILVAHHRHTCGGLLPRMLARLGDVSCVHPLDGEALPDPRYLDGIVVLGSQHCVHDAMPGLLEEKHFLATAMEDRIPILGICFGAQLLALLQGAKVSRGRNGEHGPSQVLPTGHPWLEHDMQVMQWHRDGIHDLPGHAVRIASSNGEYPEQAFLMDRSVGIQFHPETTPAMLDRWFARETQSTRSDAFRISAHQELERMEPMRSWLGELVDRMFGVSDTQGFARNV